MSIQKVQIETTAGQGMLGVAMLLYFCLHTSSCVEVYAVRDAIDRNTAAIEGLRREVAAHGECPTAEETP